jgi:DNA replication protein DnaC
MSRISEIVERCKAISETPEFQTNAKELQQAAGDFQQRSAEMERVYRLKMSGIPESFWSVLAKAPEYRPALIAAQELLDGPPERRFVVLAGPKGRGKSFALSWAVNRDGGRFVDVQELVTAGSFDRLLWDDLESATVLALDELGAEYLNEAYLASLFNLLNRRYMQNRKTLIATNLEAAAFRERYLAAGMDRLLDRLSTAGEWVTLPGESMRRHWSDTEGE